MLRAYSTPAMWRDNIQYMSFDMDLSKKFPRSPKDKLGGISWLPRMIDKARASADGTAGDYHYNCVMDARLLKFLGVAPEVMLEAIKNAKDDNGVMEWIKAQTSPRSSAAVEEFNTMMAELSPTSPEMIKRFEATRDRLAPGRTDITTWLALLDLEEGR